jgi:hypothetical protein
MAVAHALHTAGVPATEEAIRAALRPSRAPDVDREAVAGYLAACERWGVEPSRAEMLEGQEAATTVRPRARR